MTRFRVYRVWNLKIDEKVLIIKLDNGNNSMLLSTNNVENYCILKDPIFYNDRLQTNYV